MYFNLPQYNIIKNGIDSKLSDILIGLNINKPAIITSKNLVKYSPKGDFFFDKDIDVDNIAISKLKNYDGIIGFGGGIILDKARHISYKLKVPFVSFASSLSTDAISSSIGYLSNNSVFFKSPSAVIIDLEIINNSPKRLSVAGYGDLMAKISANLDWELAGKENGDFFDKDISKLAKGTTHNMLNFVLKNKLDFSVFNYQLSKALFLCGLLPSLTKSSRGLSGAEHSFEKALLKILNDKNLKVDALHGEIVGVATLLSLYLHELENKKMKGVREVNKKIKDSYKKIGHPTTFKELGIKFEDALEALLSAHKIRNRYSILRGGVDKNLAIKVLKQYY